jgi:hypothetical protein
VKGPGEENCGSGVGRGCLGAFTERHLIPPSQVDADTTFGFIAFIVSSWEDSESQVGDMGF